MANFDPPVKALFFDVFGTCVDWRKTVTNALWHYAQEALNSATSSLSSQIRIKASDMTMEEWGDIAEEWRRSYLTFTKGIAADPTIPYKTVDEHHLDSLRRILTERGLLFPRTGDEPADLIHDGSLWDEEHIVQLSRVWHILDPWPDTSQGIRLLNKKYQTCTLSNGNVELLEDMVRHASMEFTHIYSSQMFDSYKPNSKVYLGAANKIGLRPEECMMVAAHLDDLKFAKQNGMRTLYVERPKEERRPDLLLEGIPDIYVKGDQNGFITAAERLGIEAST